MENVHNKMSNVQEQVSNAMERMGEAAQTVGQKVSDFFQGSPFDTPVGRKIELATDASKLATENWGLNMEICDFINSTNEGPRDAVKAIRKRLQTQMGKNNTIVMYTLTVLETCVKNCDERFTTLVCQKEFVADMIRLISVKYDAPQIVQERVLALVQSWADAFRDYPAFSGVVEMYDELKSKGVEFPATNLDSMAPIITPKQTVFVPLSQTAPPQQQQFPNRPFSSSSPSQPMLQLVQDQMAKLRSELDLVHVNMTVLRELIAQMKPGNSKEPPEDFYFINELYATCKEMQKRVLELIPVVANEEVTYELLSINDEFNATFGKYERCMSNFNANGIDLTMVESGKIGNDLIDFGENNGKEKINIITTKSSSIELNKNNDGLANDQVEGIGIRTIAFNKPDAQIGQEENVKEAVETFPAGAFGFVFVLTTGSAFCGNSSIFCCSTITIATTLSNNQPNIYDEPKKNNRNCYYLPKHYKPQYSSS
ncbi:hypothetical protein Mgra_00007840 [Meloidogyne graminicola]|uniref:VHS domain-containing protein n=1 Tax=Meloidogyne graminicola TaxID=189291 RepID=A0A8S9ZHN1_9BILA|nr:hypothetical protein Mgra_00007840 [Meloidogyne graminicola]